MREFGGRKLATITTRDIQRFLALTAASCLRGYAARCGRMAGCPNAQRR
jgi:hypothetical protein